MIKAIAEYIALKTGWTLGGRLQFGVWDTGAPDRAAKVAFNAGGRSFFNIPTMNDVQVQVITRSPATDYVQAFDDAMTVYSRIHGRISAGTILPIVESGKMYIAQTIEAVAPPQYLGPDDTGRHQVSTNYTFRIKEG